MPSNEGISIIVSGSPHKWNSREISYIEVVTLFEPSAPQHPEITYSVMFDHGPPENPEGILPFGKSVWVREGMVFNVTPTGES